MTARLEHELRRLLADPPVGLSEPVDPSGPLAALERRVARVRARRRAGAALSVAALLAAGLAGAGQLGIVRTGPPPPAAVAGQVPREPGLAGAQPQADGQAGQPPPEVLAAAREALTEVSGGTVVQPVRWVATGDGYLVQIRFTQPVTCRYCQDPAASPRTVRGPVLEVRVPAPVPTDMPAPSSAPGGAASSDRHTSAVYNLPLRWSVRQEPTDLSRYGPVRTFALTR